MVEILPQSGAMVLLARVIEHTQDATRCAAEIGDEVLLRCSSGDVPAWMGLEYMGQCTAAHSGLLCRAGGIAPRVGFLVSGRGLRFHTRRFRRGQTLTVEARRVGGGPVGMVAFECRIADADTGAILAEGRLGCFIPGDGDPDGGR
jgi:predicted hotdog family 3-hydroxylacyl-ACP dehydratase